MASTTNAAPAPVTHVETGALLGQTMGLVAVTAGFFALGAYLGRNASGGWGILSFVAALVVLLGMGAAVQRSEQLAMGLLFGFGVLTGVAVAPVLGDYAGADPRVAVAGWGSNGAVHRGVRRGRLRHASGPVRARARRVLGPGRADRLRRRADLRADPGRRADLCDRRPGDLRRSDRVRLPAATEGEDHRTAPLLAASIFLDVLNVFLFLVSLFGSGE